MSVFFILNARGDVRFFEAAEELTSWVEAIDVRNGEFEALSSLGHPLSLHAVGEIVTMDSPNGDPTHKERLREVLVEYFADSPEDCRWARAATLEELVDRCRRYFD
jgi:hypothetical protein